MIHCWVFAQRNAHTRKTAPLTSQAKFSISLSQCELDGIQRFCYCLITRAVTHQVLKWARFVFRIIIIIIFGGATSDLVLIGLRPDDTFFVVRTV